MRVVFAFLLLFLGYCWPQPFDINKFKQAEKMFNKTEYQESLKLFSFDDCKRSGKIAFLVGRNYFYLDNFNAAVDCFKMAKEFDKQNSVYFDWLGKSYGKLAEKNSGTFSKIFSYISGASISNATKAKIHFEKAVALDGKNIEALDDLFLYYLYAPKFLGGGELRVKEIMQKICQLDKAEGRWAEAIHYEHKKDYDIAEHNFKVAIQKEPLAAGRHADLAEFFVRRGRLHEALRRYEKLLSMFPENPRIIFGFSEALVKDGSSPSLNKAKKLLNKYVAMPLTPEDPLRKEAEILLRKI